MKVTLISGPSRSGKTSLVLNEMVKRHQEDPFSYLFVGPSGLYIRKIRERFLEMTGGFSATNFKPIDHFAVDIMRLLRPDWLYIHNHIMRMILREILENHDDEKYRELSNSHVFIDYIQEMIHDVKENAGFEGLFAENDEVADFLKDIYLDVSENLFKKKVYDSFDAYLAAKDYINKINFGEFGKFLILDGFHDFSPAATTFLSNICRSFEEIYITLPDDAHRKEIFYQNESIKELVDTLKNETDLEGNQCIIERVFLKKPSYPEKLKPFLKSIFSENKRDDKKANNVRVFCCHDMFKEIEKVTREVKKLITKDGYKPDDISIVAGDFPLYYQQISKSFDDYGIPYRLEGDLPILESKAIRTLLLPLETGAMGFDPEKIIAMADLGYAGKDIDNKFFESVTVNSRMLYDYPKSTFKKRKASLLNKLNKYKDLLFKKRNAIKSNSEEEFVEQECSVIDEELKRIDTEFKPALDKIFHILKPFESLRKRDCRDYRRYFENWEQLLNLKSNLELYKEENEVLALNRLFESILPDFERLLIFLGKDKLSPSNYFSYLSHILNNERYRTSRNLANRVEIHSLINARHSKKKVKFFLGFKETDYPNVRINPLYSFTQYSMHPPRDLLLTQQKQQKLNLYLAITRTEDHVFFSYPLSTIEGEPILPSPYLDEVLEASKAITEMVGNSEGKREMFQSNLSLCMSIKELKITAGNYFKTPFWENVKKMLTSVEKYVNPEYLENKFSYLNRPFNWKLECNDELRAIIGNNFSYSRLSLYNKCPFRFFLNYVLKLTEKQEGLFELNPLQEGSVLHGVLKDFFSSSFSDWETSLDNHIKKFLMFDSEVIRQFEFKRLKKIIEEYIYIREAKQPANEGEFSPSFFEVSFGFGNNKAVEIVNGIGIRGKIDRLDLDKSTGGLFLIDYKRGSSGEKEQLMLYSLAAEHLYKDEGYFVSGGTFKPLTGKTINSCAFTVNRNGDMEWNFKRSSTLDKEYILSWFSDITSSIYSGHFTPAMLSNSSRCYKCPYSESRFCSALMWRGEENYD
ncbi:MAG: ATP-dependent nuclease subunit B [Kosmotoga sp.]|nr:MAG: ATP-dependent nuclease subunit B [Kosmotoga sp.]